MRLNKVLDKDLTYKLQNKMIVILKRRRNLADGSTKKNIKGTVVDDKGRTDHWGQRGSERNFNRNNYGP